MTTGILTIDLTAIGDNWVRLKQKVGNDVSCGAVVKANAYGLGVERVAQCLWSAGCREFFVATLAEAKALRALLGESCQIFVLGGLCQDPQTDAISSQWRDYQLSPVLVTKAHVIRWAEFARQHQLPPCAIKIDTGMHRLGLLPADIEALLSTEILKELVPEYVMSHFACADVPHHPLNQQQLDVFTGCLQTLSRQLPHIKKTIANSSGIFLGESAHYDLVRPGAALYGVNPVPTESNPMLPVVGLELPIMQVKSIVEGEVVGYGAEFVAERPTRIAVVFGGYADGLRSALSNSGVVYVANHRVPIIGRISMDSMVIDITDIESPLAENLQSVEIINRHQTIDQLAQLSGTIAYEVLTNLGARYERRYID